MLSFLSRRTCHPLIKNIKLPASTIVLICGVKLELEPVCIIYEDHAGLPIPSIEECSGSLEDE